VGLPRLRLEGTAREKSRANPILGVVFWASMVYADYVFSVNVTYTDRTRHAADLPDGRLGPYVTRTSRVRVMAPTDRDALLTAHAMVAGRIGDGMVLATDLVL
jgi:hypothetical protein